MNLVKELKDITTLYYFSMSIATYFLLANDIGIWDNSLELTYLIPQGLGFVVFVYLVFILRKIILGDSRAKDISFSTLQSKAIEENNLPLHEYVNRKIEERETFNRIRLLATSCFLAIIIDLLIKGEVFKFVSDIENIAWSIIASFGTFIAFLVATEKDESDASDISHPIRQKLKKD